MVNLDMVMKNLVIGTLYVYLALVSHVTCSAKPKKHHFVLIHPKSHGAWCWYKMIALLRSDGHNVTAFDLKAAGIDPRQVGDIRPTGSALDYSEPLMKFMKNLDSDERVVLVGHGLGGLSLTLAMERFSNKISVAVFVTGYMLGHNLTFPYLFAENLRRIGSLMDSRYIFGNGPKNPPTAFLPGPNFIASKIYQLSSPKDLVLGLSLIRPSPLFNNDTLILKETKITKNNYGSVRRVFIMCDQDYLIDFGLQLLIIEKNPPNEVMIINGTDHMSMFTSPLKLFSYLGQIADKYDY